MEDENYIELEKFYVYRKISYESEAWGAILLGSPTDKLPNINFGMRIFAKNEKEAIDRARRKYDETYDVHNKDKMVKDFANKAMSAILSKYNVEELNDNLLDIIAEKSLKSAKLMVSRILELNI